MMDSSLILPAVEIETAVPVSGSVIWLHGLGADGHDFEPVIEQLGLGPGLGLRFIFPHAPHRAITINNGMVMRAWYDVRALDLSEGEDAEGIYQSATQVTALLQREQQRGIPHERIVLAGFSQGGAVVLHTGLRFTRRLGGILALSAYLPLRAQLANQADPANIGIPVLMAHGTEDQVISLATAEKSAAHLRELGYRVQLLRYPMGHGVCWEEIQAIRDWLLQIFPRHPDR